MLIHDLGVVALRKNRKTGVVRPRHDRRTDLYGVLFEDGKRERRV